ncbi:MAG: hypothetical protein WBW88_19675, partial [Rhodothermales bacterium]
MTASTTFNINPAAIDTILASQIVEAAEGVLNLQAFGSGENLAQMESRLDSILALQGLPSHVEEFVHYLYALYADVAYYEGLRDTTDLSARYADFLAEHSQSPFARAAQQRIPDALNFLGEEPYVDMIDGLTYLKLKVFLQGTYSSSTGLMGATLPANGVLPLVEPFNTPPWNNLSYPIVDYSDGSFDVSDKTDWILVSLIAADTVADRQAVLLDKSAFASAEFINLPSGLYYVVVDHRNHIAVMSDTLADLTGGYAEHDFTTGHALGTNAQKEIEPGVYAMWAGDANADSLVTAADSLIWATHLGETGYRSSDFNLDGDVSGEDFVLWLQNSFALAGPFDLGALLDRIATYPSIAEAQGWITDPILVGDLGGVLQDASLALTSGDSTWAASLLGSALAQVEEENGVTITTEGYELLNGSIEDALSHLPPTLEVKVLLEGAYSTAT